QQRGQVVTVDRAEVVEAHLLEDGSRQQHALDVLLGAARQLAQASQRGYLLESAFAAGAQLRIEAAGDNASEVVRQGTDVFGDGHVVVVEHDQQVHRQAASVIERLEG